MAACDWRDMAISAADGSMPYSAQNVPASASRSAFLVSGGRLTVSDTLVVFGHRHDRIHAQLHTGRRNQMNSHRVERVVVVQTKTPLECRLLISAWYRGVVINADFSQCVIESARPTMTDDAPGCG